MCKRDKAALYDIVRGLHSGMPICCVAFFVRTWAPRVDAAKAGSGADRRYVQRHIAKCSGLKKGHRPNYVPCPVCLRAKTFVRIHRCTEKCRREPGSTWPTQLAVKRLLAQRRKLGWFGKQKLKRVAQ